MPTLPASTSPAALDDAMGLLRDCPGVDLHTDTIRAALAGVDLLAENRTQAHPRALAAGGFGDAVYAAWIPPHLSRDDAWERVTRMVGGVHDVQTEAVDAELSVRVWPAVEDARCLTGHPERVSQLSRWGVRYVTLTWNAGNRFATSCEDTRTGGLTPEGRALVEHLESLSITVDISHASDRTIRDVLDVGRRAPIASHSSARAVRRHPRNVSDALARAIVDRGGVVGVNVFPLFLHDVYRDAGLEHVVAHIEHLWRVVGDDGVAFGSDYDGIPDPPRDLGDSARFPILVAELLARGHAVERVQKFVRRNAVRALELPERP